MPLSRLPAGAGPARWRQTNSPRRHRRLKEPYVPEILRPEAIRKGSGLLRATLALSIILLAAYLIAVWAMAGKPG
jgi:hypothetical protein